MEDFNTLLYKEQVELIRARNAPTPTGRLEHDRKAFRFTVRIREHAYPYRTPPEQGHAPFDWAEPHSPDECVH